MSKQQFEGRSAAEAAIKACESLGVTRSELKYNVVSDTGELMARKVVIETETQAKAPAPKRESRPKPELGDDEGGNQSFGYGQPAAPKEGGSLRNDRAARKTSTRPERDVAEAESAPARAHATSNTPHDDAPASRPPRSREPREPREPKEGNERAPRQRGERSERQEAAPRKQDAPAGRRRGGEGRNDRGRGRGEGQDRGHHDGIDSLLQIAPSENPTSRHPAIDATSVRSKRALTVVADILRLMGMQADTVLVSENEAEVHVHLYGSDEARIIGKKGEVLLALQFVVNRILSRGEDEGDQVVVLDAGGYRERRQKALEALAKTLAERSVAERKAVRLSPMSAHDRRIFHMVLKDIDTVGTRSEGDGLYRHLLIIPAEFC